VAGLGWFPEEFVERIARDGIGQFEHGHGVLIVTTFSFVPRDLEAGVDEAGEEAVIVVGMRGDLFQGLDLGGRERFVDEGITDGFQRVVHTEGLRMGGEKNTLAGNPCQQHDRALARSHDARNAATRTVGTFGRRAGVPLAIRDRVHR